MTDLRTRAIQIYDAFTHEHRDRRTLIKQMAALAGSVAAAEVLIAGIAASPAAASITKADDPRLVTRKGAYAIGAGQQLTGYFASPRAADAWRGRAHYRGLRRRRRRRRAAPGLDGRAPHVRRAGSLAAIRRSASQRRAVIDKFPGPVHIKAGQIYPVAKTA